MNASSGIQVGLIRLATLVLFLAFCSQPQASSASNPCGTNLAAQTKRFVDDMRVKNIDDILALYTPDATFFDPSGATITGSDALRTFYQHIFATYDSDLILTPDTFSKTSSHGIQLCVESGKYTENMRVRSTMEMQHPHGTYRFTYRLRHSPDRNPEWLLYRQQWGDDQLSKTQH
jgi:ketosteroid isomerase-like protein